MVRFSTGIWDWLFGKKTILNLGDGKQRKVSKAWLDGMVREQQVQPVITVNILDPGCGASLEDVENLAELCEKEV